MPDAIREFKNYGGLKLKARDRQTLECFTLGAIPMRLFLYDGVLKLTVEVFDIEDFERGLPSKSPFNQIFEIDYLDAKEQFPDFFNSIESSILTWLEVSQANYSLEYFDINLTNLQIKARAQHKTRANKEIADETNSLEEFEQIKIDYPQLVQGYFGFAITYFKTHDAKLALFK